MNKKLNKYTNGNHKVTIYSDGTKVKETIDPKADHFTYDFPENFDIKITDQCDGGCSYCHENSTVNGKHGDLKALEPMIATLHAGTECACLRGNTIVHTPYGSKEIKDLKVGDTIFNGKNGVSVVSKIAKSDKTVWKLKFNRGISVESSADHPFMSDGREICAANMPDKVIDVIPVVQSGTNDVIVIDMAQYIHKANPKRVSSRGGCILNDNEIRLTNSSAHSARYISFDIDMAYLYGWFVAEGSRSNLTMCSDEIDYAERLGDIWSSHTKLPFLTTVYATRNSLNLELKNRAFVKHLMFDALSVGKGAKNKNLSFLYKVDNIEIIRSALLGLFLGDGCFRTRQNNHNGHTYQNTVISLKTSSKHLAYDVMYLLRKWFGIEASICSGIAKKGRAIDGRVLPDSYYYMVEIYDNSDQHKLFPEHFELKSQHLSYARRAIKCVSCGCDDLEYKEPLYDITLAGNVHTFPVNGYLVTHNCGGGNALAHPDLVWFLERLKEQGVIANITINQRHLRPYKDLICKIVGEGLVHGIGISLTDASNTDDFAFIDTLGNNVVIHTIAGILSEKDIAPLMGRKILILGYKDLRRGHTLLEKQSDEIKANIKWLQSLLARIGSTNINPFKVISFDCLGIEQLNPKAFLNISDARYDALFQGSDTDVKDADGNITCATMYIDVPNMQVARMSTAALDKRYPFTGKENIHDLLQITTQGW